MKYYNFFLNLEDKFSLSELGNILDGLKITAYGFNFIQIDSEPEIEKWLVEIGFAENNRRGLCKTNKFDKFYDDFSDKLWAYVYEDSDGEFDKDLDIPIELLASCITGKIDNSEELIFKPKEDNKSLNLSIKDLLIKGINPLTLQNELYDLEGTSPFNCLVNIDGNIEEWLKENKVIESSTKGAVYCKDNKLRIDLYNQLKSLLEVEYSLYKINFVHYSQKDNETGTKKMVITTSEDKVFEYLCQGVEALDEMVFFTLWSDWEEDELKLVRENKGDTFLKDNYSRYGTTRWYWEEVSKISYEEIISLLKLKLVEIL